MNSVNLNPRNKEPCHRRRNFLSHTQVDMSEVTSANFARNKATFAGGAIFADDASTTISSNEYNHTLAQGLFGRCFLIFGNELNIHSVSE